MLTIHNMISHVSNTMSIIAYTTSDVFLQSIPYYNYTQCKETIVS